MQNLYTGIYLTGEGNNTAIGNTCTGNSRYGIHVEADAGDSVTGNTCKGNNYYGIYLASASINSVTGNTCLKNLAGGIVLDASCTSITVVGNWIKKNVPNSIQDDGTGNTITGNFFIGYPQASFSITPATISTGQDVQFSDTTINGSLPLAYQWNFGDGTGNVTHKNPVHQFTSAGAFILTLTVTDADGDVSVDQKTINVQKSGQDGIAGYNPFLLLGISGVILMVIMRNRRTWLTS